MKDLDQDYPAVDDLRRRAKRRLPRFVWDFLDSGTGSEAAVTRNRTALDDILLRPGVLFGELEFDLRTSFLGRDYAMPFGIAPIGMSGLVWPGAEVTMARVAKARNIPFSTSCVCTQLPETVGPEGVDGWFQLYPPRDEDMRKDMLKRAKDSGFRTLVLTVDVPIASRRERQRRGGVTNPARLSPRIIAQCAIRPAWSLATSRTGIPRLALIESYTGRSGALPSTEHIGYLVRTSPDWDYVKWLRDAWDGPFIVKGVLDPDDAVRLKNEGTDSVWVSNHGGRQTEGAPSPVAVLPAIREAVGPDYPLIFDSGVRGGLDVLRALALGADFVFLGRAFHYGMAAFGQAGVEHVVHILEDDMKSNLGQLGLATPRNLSGRLMRAS